MRAAGGAFSLSMTVLKVAMASGAHCWANALTSASTLRASIVRGLFGRPPGLPETPGLKLVDRIPPRDIASTRLLVACST